MVATYETVFAIRAGPLTVGAALITATPWSRCSHGVPRGCKRSPDPRPKGRSAMGSPGNSSAKRGRRYGNAGRQMVDPPRILLSGCSRCAQMHRKSSRSRDEIQQIAIRRPGGGDVHIRSGRNGNPLRFASQRFALQAGDEDPPRVRPGLRMESNPASVRRESRAVKRVRRMHRNFLRRSRRHVQHPDAWCPRAWLKKQPAAVTRPVGGETAVTTDFTGSASPGVHQINWLLRIFDDPIGHLRAIRRQAWVSFFHGRRGGQGEVAFRREIPEPDVS